MTAQDRLEKIAAFAKDRLEDLARQYPSPEHDPIYRWEHTLRVAQYGEQIARAEGADVEVVVTACLLHDVAHFDPLPNYKDHGREGARLSRPLLVETGYPPEKMENICYSIAVHVDGKAGFEHPETLESKVVSDADNVDRFGAFRILQWCVPEMGHLPALADILRQRISRLEGYRNANPLETASGQALFAHQLDRQIAFFKAILAEYELTALPQLCSPADCYPVQIVGATPSGGLKTDTRSEDGHKRSPEVLRGLVATVPGGGEEFDQVLAVYP